MPFMTEAETLVQIEEIKTRQQELADAMKVVAHDALRNPVLLEAHAKWTKRLDDLIAERRMLEGALPMIIRDEKNRERGIFPNSKVSK